MFRKTVAHTGMRQCVVHAEITITGFYKIFNYNMFDIFENIDMNIKHSSSNILYLHIL